MKFEEEFPELVKDFADICASFDHGWTEEQIQKHCLSKQRVREAILMCEVGIDPKHLLKELGLEERE